MKKHLSVAGATTAPIDTKRRVMMLGTAAIAAGLVPAGQLLAGTESTADFLFVQTSRGMTYDAASKSLTLTGVSPITLFFSDRPERVAGNMTTRRFVPFWSEGKDSFLSDPPNADLSILENGALVQTVVVLMDPVLEGEDLRYTVDIVEGTLPATAAEVSVFIDVIGMPLTPVSYAGVARRTVRRAAIY